MKKLLTLTPRNGNENYTVVSFGFSLVKGFFSKEKMDEWIKSIKKTRPFAGEPEITVFRKVATRRLANVDRIVDIYEEV